MITNQNLEKWQKAVLGIEAKQSDLSPEELSAFAALKTLFANRNFAVVGSSDFIKIFKNNLSKHSGNRLLSAHLKIFIEVCNNCFTDKTAPIVSPSVGTQPPIAQSQPPVVQSQLPVVLPQPSVVVPAFVPTAQQLGNTNQSVAPPTFGGIPQADISEWQKAIAGIEGKQNELAPDELSAFEILKEKCRNGNFISNESILKIRIIKNLQNRTKDRLMLVHLKTFVVLCEKYFKATTPTNTPIATISTFTPPSIVPPSQSQSQLSRSGARKNSSSPKISNKRVIIIVIAIFVLIGVWYANQNWDTVIKPFLVDQGIITHADSAKIEVSFQSNEKNSIVESPQEQSQQLKNDVAEKNADTMGTGFGKVLPTPVLKQKQSQQLKTDSTSNHSSKKAMPDPVSIPVTGGTYKGETKGGKPHGMGTIHYSSRTLIDSRDIKKRYAEAGQYIVGQFKDGRLVQGKLFDSSGNQIDTIIIGG